MTDLDSLLPGAGGGSEPTTHTRARSTEEGGSPPLRQLIDPPKQRPALAKLQQDQGDVISALEAGFDGVGEVVKWAVETNVRTLGSLPREFYHEKITGRLELQWLTEQQFTTRDVDERTARGYREDLALEVATAANRAYREFRERVTEYTDDKTPKASVSGGTVAFRPALTELEERQGAALLDARSGFANRRDLAAWERDMQAATFGEYDRQPDYPIASAPCSWEFGLLLRESGEPLPSRDLYLLRRVFPACIRGVRYLREQAEEQVDGQSSKESLDA